MKKDINDKRKEIYVIKMKKKEEAIQIMQEKSQTKYMKVKEKNVEE